MDVDFVGSAWSSDFSYGYFKRLLEAICTHFEPHLLYEAPEILPLRKKPRLILRHDIDVSLNRALRMAQIENDFGIRATYMFIPDSTLYSLEDRLSRAILRQFVAMGHEVALHFDIGEALRNSNHELSLSAIDAKILLDRKRLENVTDLPVKSISFHRPVPQFLHGPLWISGMVSAYAHELMECYLADSKGHWRTGEPLPKLTGPENQLLQLLIHPIWWGDTHMAPEDRLQEFFEAATHGMSSQVVEAFDVNLAKTVPAVRRQRFAHRG